MKWRRRRPPSPLHVTWNDSGGANDKLLYPRDTLTILSENAEPVLRCEYDSDGRLRLTALAFWATIDREALRQHLAHLDRVS